jgi:hypothetical protein
MVRISIFYPNKTGARFDLLYYIETHVPMSIRLLSAHAGFRGVTTVRGVSGSALAVAERARMKNSCAE